MKWKYSCMIWNCATIIVHRSSALCWTDYEPVTKIWPCHIKFSIYRTLCSIKNIPATEQCEVKLLSLLRILERGGHAVAQLVEATSRKDVGSIPYGVIGIFHWYNPSGRTLALRANQPLTKMSTRNISWRIKAADAESWRPYRLNVPIVLKFGSLNHLETSGSVQARNGIALRIPLSSLWNFSKMTDQLPHRWN